MKKIATSKMIAVSILAADILLSATTLGLCYLSVIRNYNGSLPYLTALIGLYQGATGYVLGKYVGAHEPQFVYRIVLELSSFVILGYLIVGC